MHPPQPVRQLQNQQLEIFDRRSIRGVIAMGSTAVEKIISSALGRKVSEGEFVEAPVDFAYFHDGTGPLVIDALDEIPGFVFGGYAAQRLIVAVQRYRPTFSA